MIRKPHTSRTLLIVYSAAALQLSLTAATSAANRFWDLNGSNAGAGSTPTGVWNGSNSYWTTDSTGSAVPGLSDVGIGNDGFFSAGTDATGEFTVTVSGTRNVQSLTFQEGTPTLTGGVIAFDRASGSSAPTLSGFIAASTLQGTALVASGVQIDTTISGTNLFRLVANNSTATALEFKLTGTITTSATGNAYALRLGGNGNGRIESALATSGGATLTDVQQGNTNWAGTWTIAGNQSLGNASLALSSTGAFSAGAKLVMGDGVTDTQSWSSTAVNNANAAMIIRSDATVSSTTTVGVGTLQIAGLYKPSGTSGTLSLGGSATTGILQMSDGTTAGAGTFNGLTIATNGAGKIVGGAASAGTITLVVASASSVAPAAGSLTIGGGGTNENKVALVKDGGGSLTLNNTNTYTGGTTIVNGSTDVAIQLGANDALGLGPLVLGSAATTGNGARLRLAGFNQTVTSLSSGATSSTLVIENNSATATASTLTVDQSTDTAYSGYLRDVNTGAGTLTLVKKGSGLLDLSSATVTLSAVSIEAGTIGFKSIATSSTPGFIPGSLTLAGGALKYLNTTTNAGSDTRGLILTASTTSTIDQPQTTPLVRFGGKVTGSGNLIKTGAGEFQFGKANDSDTTNDFTGTVDVQAGTLTLRAKDALGSTSGGTKVSGANAVLKLSPDFGALTYDAEPLELAANTALRNGQFNNAWQGAITLSGSAKIVANGGSKLTLTSSATISKSSNTLTIGDAQNTGTVLINSTVSGAGSINLNAGALGGAGTLTGNVSAAAGTTISPGNSVGRLTLNNDLSLANDVTSTIDLEVGGAPANGGTDFDILVVNGNLTIGGSRLNITPLANAVVGQEYYIIRAGNSYSTASNNKFGKLNNQVDTLFSGLFETTASDVFRYQLRYDDSTTDGKGVYITFNAVPEPTTGVISLGLGWMLAQRRRRTKAYA